MSGTTLWRAALRITIVAASVAARWRPLPFGA
jgi:hypothetical protein